MMRKHRTLRLAIMACIGVLFVCATAFATGNTDWDSGEITAEGFGAAPASASSAGQAKALARRAAIVDAYRNLGEFTNGVRVDSETVVQDMLIASDTIKTRMSALIKGAVVAAESVNSDGIYQVTLKIPMYGAQSSLARVVLPEHSVMEPFPEPILSVMPTLQTLPIRAIPQYAASQVSTLPLPVSQSPTPQVMTAQSAMPPLPTPQAATAQVPTPQMVTPQMVTPQVATAQVPTPQVAAPQAATAQVPTPQVVAPQVVTPQVAAPQVATAQVPTSQASTLQLPVPQVSIPQLPIPELPMPQLPAPQVATPPLPTAEVTTPQTPTPQSAAPSGAYTGVVIDCRGLDLNCAMSPVIFDAADRPIYGHKNLDYTKVVQNGMAAYSKDGTSNMTRAGGNPLVMKAVRVTGHNTNPVLSQQDANRLLTENQASGFLNQCAVVFIR